MSTNPEASAAKRRIYEDIARELAARINSGDYPDKSLLPSERELVREFGASRTSVRQALLTLQSAGLVALRDRARAQVTHLNNSAFFDQLAGSAQTLLARPNGVADFQEARLLFECGLVRHAARYGSPKEIDRLGYALAANRRALNDPDEFARTDLAFHDILAEIPRNPIFVALNTALSEWLAEQRRVGIQAPVKGAMKKAYEGHARIFEAIAGHDVEAADQAMVDHLKTVASLYWKASSQEG